MQDNMVELKVTVIEAFDLDRQPGWCEAVLVESDGSEHILVDKLPVIGLDFDEIPQLPLEKYIRVEIVRDMGDELEVSTEHPDDIQAQDGKTSFIVSRDKIRSRDK